MRLNLLSDAHWESGVGKVLDALSSTGYRSRFAAHNYGTGLSGITVVFMCQEPNLNLKKRVKLDKKEKKVYLDIMLDLTLMRQAKHEDRKKIIIERLTEEIPKVLNEYSVSDFDKARFVEDLSHWIREIE